MTVRIKNRVALTLFLIAPLVCVGGLVAFIYVSLGREPLMRADAVGQGASDTGGANALGEFLAGRDPDEIRRRNEVLRAGEFIRVSDVSAPLTVQVTGVGEAREVALVLVEGRDAPVTIPLSRAQANTWVATLKSGDLRSTTRLKLRIDGRLGPERDFPLLPREAAGDDAPVVVIEAGD